MKAAVALLAATLCATVAGRAHAQDLPTDAVTIQEKVSESEATDAARRNSQAGVDPWLASSVTLFGRPTFREAVKLSTEADEDGNTVFGAATSLAQFGVDNKWIDTLQVNASYTPSSRTVMVGLKFNLDLSDIRFLSEKDFKRQYHDEAARSKTAAMAKEVLDACKARVPVVAPAATESGGPVRAGDRIQVNNNDAGAANDEELADLCDVAVVQDAIVDSILAKRKDQHWPKLSLAVGGGYDREDESWKDFAAELAGEFTLGPVAVTLNADLTHQEDAALMTTSWKAGGGPQASITLSDWFEGSAGGKVLACLSDCGDDTSSIEFGGKASFRLTDEYALAGSLTWKGTGDDIAEAIAGLAMSYSFGPKGPDKSD